MIINHIATEDNWNREEILQNANILVLGSFNPFNPNGDNTDYYYGRCTNYFWKAIAEITNINPNFYFNNLQAKLDFMIDKKICFLDVIKSIEITQENSGNEFINRFSERKIFTEFSDQVLFTTNTRFENNGIKVTRNYNDSIHHLLNQGNIEKIIHTMGNNTINLDFETKWKEHRLGEKGFQGFINSIVNYDVNFVNLSFSPSGRVVKVNGMSYLNELKNWINEHLNLT